MALGEKAIILAQNLLNSAELSASSIPGHEVERMRDGFKHTWWEAPSTATQFIVLEKENLVINPDFEVDLPPWADFAFGGGVGTFTRNTSSPLFGDADGLMTVTTADSGTDIYLILNGKPLEMKAGRTYRIQFAAMVQDASSKNIRFGFVDEDLAEDAALFDTQPVGTVATGLHADFVATKDQCVYPYVRALEPQTLQLDEFNANEVRDVDTLIIGAGHTMRQANITVERRDIPSALPGGWITVLSLAKWKSDLPVYLTFTPSKALSWRVTILVDTLFPFTPVAQIPILFLGKRWELDNMNFVSSYDPNQNNRQENRFVGEKGMQFDTLKFNQRVIKATLAPFVGSDYDDLRQFFEDTENGARPFFFIRFPVTDLADILYIRLRRGENAPFLSAGIRTWALDAEEIIGDRVI